jgi:hypothetical protein
MIGIDIFFVHSNINVLATDISQGIQTNLSTDKIKK